MNGVLAFREILESNTAILAALALIAGGNEDRAGAWDSAVYCLGKGVRSVQRRVIIRRRETKRASKTSRESPL